MATSDFNFRAITLPGVGELTAYSLGTASVFSSNTPASFYQDALERLGNFFQQPTGRGQVTNPRNENPWRPGMPVPPGYRVTTIRGRQVLIPTTEGQAGPITPGINPDAPVPSLGDIAGQYPGAPVAPGVDPGGLNAPLTPEELERARNYRQPRITSVTCGDYDYVCQLRNWFRETDAVTRGVLVLIAIVLLAVGVISLR